MSGKLFDFRLTKMYVAVGMWAIKQLDIASNGQALRLMSEGCCQL